MHRLVVISYAIIALLSSQCIECYPLTDSSGDNNLSITQDSCTSPFPISGSFPIFGVSKSSYIISSSFVTSFDVTSGCDPTLNFDLAPISTAQNAMVSAFYADWDSTNINGICKLKFFFVIFTNMFVSLLLSFSNLQTWSLHWPLSYVIVLLE